MKWFMEDDFCQKTVEKISKEVTDIIISQIKSAIDDKDAIEERAKAYSQSDDPAIVKAYMEGAMAQKYIEEETRREKRDDVTEEEYNRQKSFFVDWYFRNRKGTPTYSDAIEWARKKLLEEACEWLKGNIEGGVHPQSVYGFVDKFRKAMEEQLWQ